MRDRNRKKVRELEGENRQLDKELRKARVEISRLQKYNSRQIPTEDSTPRPVELAPTKREKNCKECGSKASELILQDAKGNRKAYLICKNISCKYKERL